MACRMSDAQNKLQRQNFWGLCPGESLWLQLTALALDTLRKGKFKTKYQKRKHNDHSVLFYFPDLLSPCNKLSLQCAASGEQRLGLLAFRPWWCYFPMHKPDQKLKR